MRGGVEREGGERGGENERKKEGWYWWEQREEMDGIFLIGIFDLLCRNKY